MQPSRRVVGEPLGQDRHPRLSRCHVGLALVALETRRDQVRLLAGVTSPGYRDDVVDGEPVRRLAPLPTAEPTGVMIPLEDHVLQLLVHGAKVSRGVKSRTSREDSR